jgi:hypothetical protein
MSLLLIRESSNLIGKFALVAASLGSWGTGPGLSAIRATAAAVGCFPLFAVLVHVTDEHPAIYAGVGALVLVVAVVILGGWVRRARGRLTHVNLLSRLAGSRGVGSTCGAIYVVSLFYYTP